ncbi:SlyX family protein [Puniceicoccaceae bacterium K14]|nr:SlyX family protein [Puniceicoccaceae bacterium K14]
MEPSSAQELETKIAFIERHIEEQDRVILKLQQHVDTLEARLKKLEDAQEDSDNQMQQTGLEDERPPHY